MASVLDIAVESETIENQDGTTTVRVYERDGKTVEKDTVIPATKRDGSAFTPTERENAIALPTALAEANRAGELAICAVTGGKNYPRLAKALKIVNWATDDVYDAHKKLWGKGEKMTPERMHAIADDVDDDELMEIMEVALSILKARRKLLDVRQVPLKGGAFPKDVAECFTYWIVKPPTADVLELQKLRMVGMIRG